MTVDLRYCDSYYHGLQRVRDHIVRLRRAAQPGGGSHDDVCYHFYAGTLLLMSLFDCIAMYVDQIFQINDNYDVIGRLRGSMNARI
jgi:hypothetical protein